MSPDLSLGGSSASVAAKQPGELAAPRSLVVLAGVTGPSQPTLDRILAHLDTAATGSNLALVNDAGSNGPYRIQGHLLISPQKKQTTSILSYVWTVTNADGSRRAQVTGSETVAPIGADAWAGVTDQMLKTMAEKVMLAVIQEDAPVAQVPTGYAPASSGPTPAAFAPGPTQTASF